MARYFELRNKDVKQLAYSFGLHPTRWEYLPGGKANTSYLLVQRNKRFILTIFGDPTVNPEKISKVMLHLVANGVLVTVPLNPTKEMARVIWDGHPVTIKPYIAGHCAIEFPEHLVANAGELLARIHLTPSPEGLPVGSRRFNYEHIASITGVAPAEFLDWLKFNLETTESVDTFSGPEGLVHGDYWPDNLVVTPSEDLVPIDWETVARDLFIIDVGWALTGFSLANGKFNPVRAKTFLQGYENVRVLPAEERNLIGDATVRAAAAIAIGRFWRHHVAFPDRSKHDEYRKLVEIGNDARRTMRLWGKDDRNS